MKEKHSEAAKDETVPEVGGSTMLQTEERPLDDTSSSDDETYFSL